MSAQDLLTMQRQFDQIHDAIDVCNDINTLHTLGALMDNALEICKTPIVQDSSCFDPNAVATTFVNTLTQNLSSKGMSITELFKAYKTWLKVYNPAIYVVATKDDLETVMNSKFGAKNSTGKWFVTV